MPGALIAGLVLVFILNLAADRLRDRVDVIQSATRLTVRSQQAALRLDAITLVVCALALLYALATRSTLLVIVAAGAAAAVGWRLLKARRAPQITFDRDGNAVWRDRVALCDLTAVSGLVPVVGEGASSLVLNYRDRAGQPRQELIYRARSERVAALHAALTDFLQRG